MGGCFVARSSREWSTDDQNPKAQSGWLLRVRFSHEPFCSDHTIRVVVHPSSKRTQQIPRDCCAVTPPCVLHQEPFHRGAIDEASVSMRGRRWPAAPSLQMHTGVTDRERRRRGRRRGGGVGGVVVVGWVVGFDSIRTCQAQQPAPTMTHHYHTTL